MIIMLNGSFGVGKTTVAEQLRARLPGAMVYDPEWVGLMVRAATEGIRTGDEDTDDFQDIAIWRTLVVSTARALYQRYRRPLIVPMTLVNRGYLMTIRTGLEALGQPVHHFCLTASLATIQQRLRVRGEQQGGWAWVRAEQYVPLFAHTVYQMHISTEHQTAGEVADRIVTMVQATA